MSNGITLKVLGDYGPFSREGKSIGYRVNIGESSYLVDCGSPLFNQIGGHGLKDIKGLFITHCHDDHKRWFTDLALFYMYAPDLSHKLTLYTTDIINDELKCSSGPALENSLSICRKKIVDIPYENYIDFQRIGPCARYKIVSRDEGSGKATLYVMGREGNVAGPDISKIVISTKTGKPRMLFKDPVCGEWVEPESFYSFSAEAFYEKEQNIYSDPEGFTIEAVKAVSELFCPVAGEVVEVNQALESDPSLVNKDPYGAGWMFKLKPASKAEVDALMDAKAYEALVASEKH